MSDEINNGIMESTPTPEKKEEETLKGESQIPEKFLGKSQEDIIKSYQELESELGRLRNEYGNAKKERDDILRHYQEMVSMNQRQPQEQQSDDPYAYFEQTFENDPKTAIREALKKQEQRLLASQQAQLLNLKQAELYKAYAERKANPDFARREALMQQLAMKFSSLLNSQAAYSPEILELLDLASKGADISFYEKEAVERARRNGLSSRDEKLKSRSESSTTSTGKDVDFEKLSLEEMEKILGRAEP